MSESDQKKLDAVGLFCPEPVFRTKIEIERMQVGQVLIVSADDPAAEDASRKDGAIMRKQIIIGKEFLIFNFLYISYHLLVFY